MGRKEIFIGLFVILTIVGIAVGVKKAKSPKSPLVIPTPGVQKKIEDAFKLVIPEDLERVELNKISDIEGTGIATRKYQNGKFSHMILADLPDPENGMFYQGWLQKDEGNIISTGKLRLAKGGYLLEFESNIDYSDHKKVFVTLEKVLDNNLEKRILEGSF